MKQITKTTKLDKNTNVEVSGEWDDTSFDDHEQGYYEVTEVFINEESIPLDILTDSFLDRMRELINRGNNET